MTLSDKEKAEIRKLYESTKDLPATRKIVTPNPERWSLVRLGERFGVSRETIRRVLAEEGDDDE